MKTFQTLILAAAAQATLVDDVSAVASAANVISPLVQSWNSGQGLLGALAIQENFGPLSSAVSQLSVAAAAVTNADITSNAASSLSDMTASVTNLLNALTAKAGDFNAVGAGAIVTDDINQLGAPAGSIVSNLVAFGKGNGHCDLVNSLSAPVGSLSGAFASAGAAFSASAVSFPDMSC